jgi:hypothetical protein
VELSGDDFGDEWEQKLASCNPQIFNHDKKRKLSGGNQYLSGYIPFDISVDTRHYFQ